MRIEILDSAEKDLLDSFKFYERQSKGLGNYFLESIFSDIDSLNLYAGICTTCVYTDYVSIVFSISVIIFCL